MSGSTSRCRSTLTFVDRWMLGRLQRREARHRDAARRRTASTSRPRRSTNSSGTSIATGTSSSRRCSSRAPKRRATPPQRGHAVDARARARSDAAPRASVHSVHHRGALADRRAARRQERRDDLSCSRIPKANFERVDAAADTKMALLQGHRERVPHAARRDEPVAGAEGPADRRPATPRCCARVRAVPRGARAAVRRRDRRRVCPRPTRRCRSSARRG